MDSESNRIEVQEDEKKFRRQYFSEQEQVLNLDIKCTICDINLMWMLLFKKQIFSHPVLEVIVCEGCYIMCSSPEKDACIWCCKLNTQETSYTCSECPSKFCTSCITRNFGNNEIDKIKLGIVDYWMCYRCCVSKIWYQRGKCYAALETIKKMKQSEENEANEAVCAICMCNFEQNKSLNCNHKFHSGCLTKWLEVNRSCPICRNNHVQS